MSTTLYSFKDIFDSFFTDDDTSIQLKQIIIPIIQRDYAQGRINPEVNRVRERFLDALYDAVTKKPITLDFVYGDINEEGVMTPLDGQQRLTTLFLLHWYAAKRSNIEKSEYKFLECFSYETRYSARYFCKRLVAYTPTFDGVLSKEIINQPWFPLDWKKDPTISSMLVMLDAIDGHFNEVTNLWDKLEKGAISFYFLPIKDMGLTDELYIKMNSRGKPLTPFEHFKAELEKEMLLVDEEIANRIIRKFDREWMDLFWSYRNGSMGTGDDDTTDDEFLNYFGFICDVICYKQGESPQFRSSNEFDLIKLYFSRDNENALSNMETLEAFFDCWCNIPNDSSPSVFLNSFVSAEHEPGKIKIDSRYRDRIDIFEHCLHSYGRQRLFPLNRFVMLYAISCYLQYSNEIEENVFRRRIRIINNLLQNSEDEVADRIDRNRIPAILEQTESIMLTGVIDEDIENSYNVNQIQEEKEKIAFLEKYPDMHEQLFKLEDHSMLHGQISIVGLDHIDLTDSFYSLFTCNWDKIDCAMMAIGDYGQMERNGWRYQYASKGRQSAWDELFHRSRNSGFENTGNVLVDLLKTNKLFNDEKLDEIANDFIEKCEMENLYPWRYYYIKYPEFRPGSFGKFAKYGAVGGKYLYAVMRTKSYVSESTYMPYLMAADPEYVDPDEKGLILQYDDQYIECENDAFVVRDNDYEDGDDDIARIVIKQNEEGIDTEDRIVKLKKYIDENYE